MGQPPDRLQWVEVYCQHCFFWDSFPFDPKKGLCRMETPTLGPDGEKGVWPVTHDDDWCVPGRAEFMHAQDGVLDEELSTGSSGQQPAETTSSAVPGTGT